MYENDDLIQNMIQSSGISIGDRMSDLIFYLLCGKYKIFRKYTDTLLTKLLWIIWIWNTT